MYLKEKFHEKVATRRLVTGTISRFQGRTSSTENGSRAAPKGRAVERGKGTAPKVDAKRASSSPPASITARTEGTRKISYGR